MLLCRLATCGNDVVFVMACQSCCSLSSSVFLCYFVYVGFGNLFIKTETTFEKQNRIEETAKYTIIQKAKVYSYKT